MIVAAIGAEVAWLAVIGASCLAVGSLVGVPFDRSRRWGDKMASIGLMTLLVGTIGNAIDRIMDGDPFNWRIPFYVAGCLMIAYGLWRGT